MFPQGMFNIPSSSNWVMIESHSIITQLLADGHGMPIGMSNHMI
ncbi:37879_t:CDS:2 [Gigaspora margarita]|uniref:37879_t:CDS:1 n=1 Tax=Gigaspora margarita TaxID=4874 RepID=A0ABN7UK41_GIGMA|nr:37879_t:CDS:2 [Gigaspora margarita]